MSSTGGTVNTRPRRVASSFSPFCQGGYCASVAASRAAGVSGGGAAAPQKIAADIRADESETASAHRE